MRKILLNNRVWNFEKAVRRKATDKECEYLKTHRASELLNLMRRLGDTYNESSLDKTSEKSEDGNSTDSKPKSLGQRVFRYKQLVGREPTEEEIALLSQFTPNELSVIKGTMSNKAINSRKTHKSDVDTYKRRVYSFKRMAGREPTDEELELLKQYTPKRLLLFEEYGKVDCKLIKSSDLCFDVPEYSEKARREYYTYRQRVCRYKKMIGREPNEEELEFLKTHTPKDIMTIKKGKELLDI